MKVRLLQFYWIKALTEGVFQLFPTIMQTIVGHGSVLSRLWLLLLPPPTPLLPSPPSFLFRRVRPLDQTPSHISSRDTGKKPSHQHGKNTFDIVRTA